MSQGYRKKDTKCLVMVLALGVFWTKYTSFVQAPHFGKYCTDNKYGSSHTLCLPYSERKMAENEEFKILDIHMQIFITVAHNTFRNQMADGVSFNNLPAANMHIMKWNNEMADIAQRWANITEKKDNDQNRNYENFPTNQIVAVLQGPAGDAVLPIYDWANITKKWFSEHIYLSPAIIKSFSDDPKHNDIAQLSWASTTMFGCGYFRRTWDDKSDVDKRTRLYKSIMVCNYAPAGNKPGESVYSVGKPCSQCWKGFTCKTLFQNLCTEGCTEICQSNVLALFSITLLGLLAQDKQVH